MHGRSEKAPKNSVSQWKW